MERSSLISLKGVQDSSFINEQGGVGVEGPNVNMDFFRCTPFNNNDKDFRKFFAPNLCILIILSRVISKNQGR